MYPEETCKGGVLVRETSSVWRGWPQEGVWPYPLKGWRRAVWLGNLGRECWLGWEGVPLDLRGPLYPLPFLCPAMLTSCGQRHSSSGQRGLSFIAFGSSHLVQQLAWWWPGVCPGLAWAPSVPLAHF